MGNIKFEGNPPYALPIAQYVTARAEGAVVEMTLEVIVPGKEPSIVPVSRRDDAGGNRARQRALDCPRQSTNDVGFRPFLTCSIAACDNDGGGAPEAVVIPPCNCSANRGVDSTHYPPSMAELRGTLKISPVSQRA